MLAATLCNVNRGKRSGRRYKRSDFMPKVAQSARQIFEGFKMIARSQSNDP